MIRSLTKRLAEASLGSRSASSMLRKLTKREFILGYHNVIPNDQSSEGDRSLHLPVARFLEQVEWLSREFHVVPLTTLLSEPQSDEGLRIAITFDDAYEGAIQLALPILARLGVPATVFVCSSWCGGETTWWDALSDPISGAVSTNERNRALVEGRGNTGVIIKEAESRGIPVRQMPSPFRIADKDSLRKGLESGSFTVGSHTRTHPNLLALSEDELLEELSKSRTVIYETWGTKAIPWLAYPYGMSDSATARIAQAAGYEGALLVSGGVLLRPLQSRYNLPRINVPAGLSLRGLRLRSVGLL